MPARKKRKGALASSDLGPVGAFRSFAEAEKHALDRLSFWGGVGLFMLSVLLFNHGVDMVTYLATGLGGALAMIVE